MPVTSLPLGSARPPDGRNGLRQPIPARPEAGPYPRQYAPLTHP